MNCENVMLGERSQKQNITYCMTPFKWNIQNEQICADRKQMSGCQGLWGGGNGKWLMEMGFPLGVVRMFRNWIVEMVAHYEHTKSHWILYFKTVKMVNITWNLHQLEKRKEPDPKSNALIPKHILLLLPIMFFLCDKP